MKKFLISAAALLALAGAVLASTYTNQLGQVVTVTTDSNGVRTTTIVDSITGNTTPTIGTAPVNMLLTTSTGSKAAIKAAFTPQYGKFLFGTVSNMLFVAQDPTTWVQIPTVDANGVLDSTFYVGTANIPAGTIVAADIATNTITAAKFAAADWGDVTVALGGGVTVDNDVVGAAEVGPGTLSDDVLLPASVTWTNTQAIVIDGVTALSGAVTIVNGAGTGTNLVLTVVDGLIKSKTP